MPPTSLKVIYFSLLVALVCQMLPWAGFGLMVRPDFILVMTIFWLFRTPQIVNIGTAWMAGIVFDLISGAIFGQHALAFAVVAYFAVRYQRRLILFNNWQQAGYVFILLLLAQIIVLVLKLLAGGEVPGWSYFLPSISGIVLWQFLVISGVGTGSGHARRS
ncbi:MAG TPA: rod shape-determining protein MreD [Methylophilaceae bacterium]|nr:rod shape-determining protein MreD [Methylophilaceae bacterium]